MSSSPLPVPSRAALTAVRGLLVGTSCTLALVAEDRRRRINQALRVIENGEKIKSARNYHDGARVVRIEAAEDGVALFDTDSFTNVLQSHGLSILSGVRRTRSKSKTGAFVHEADIEEDSIRPSNSDFTPAAAGIRDADTATLGARRRSTTAESLMAETTPPPDHVSLLGSQRGGVQIKPAEPPKRTAEKPSWSISGADPRVTPKVRPLGPLWPALDHRILKSVAPCSLDEVATMVQEISCDDQPDSLKISRAVQALLDLPAAARRDPLWLELSASLCRTCQKFGRVRDAERILQAVLACGPIAQQDYFSHEPLTLVNFLISPEALEAHSESDYLLNLESATRIFTVKLKDKPASTKPEFRETGEALLNARFRAGRTNAVEDVLTQCLAFLDKNQSGHFAHWVVQRLRDKGEYRTAINIFLRTSGDLLFDEDVLRSLGTDLIYCVETAHSYKASLVLEELVRIGFGTCMLPVQWIIRLLNAEWTAHRNFNNIERLFQRLVSIADLATITTHPDGVYRIMTELALEAGKKEKALGYVEAAVAIRPMLRTHPRWIGLLARYEAKRGNWATVRSLFESMKSVDAETSKSHAEVFVPILKAYTKNHSVQEVQDFVKLYTEELNVPLCSYTVTLMAKHYTEIRDISSAMKWLEYCKNGGFELDAAISNAVLTMCRGANMPFRDIRTIFRKLRAMNPDFVDKNTERIMADIAMRNFPEHDKGARTLAHGRVLSLKISPYSLADRGKCAPEQDIVLAMKAAMLGGQYARVARLYRRALHMGMPCSPYALRLAVRAEMTVETNQRGHGERVYKLLRLARKHGQDISSITNYIITLKLKQLIAKPRQHGCGSPIYDEVRSLLDKFESNGIVLDDATFNWAAHACLKSRHFPGAIHFAERAAATASSDGTPCYNIHNFRTFLGAYVETLDVDGIRKTVNDALRGSYREEKECLQTLKLARKRARQVHVLAGKSDQVGVPIEVRRSEVIGILTAGISSTVEARGQLRVKRKDFEDEAMKIMQAAALEMGCPPEGFDDLPWTGMGQEGNHDPCSPVLQTCVGTSTELNVSAMA